MNPTQLSIEATHQGLGHLQSALYDTYRNREKYGRNYRLMAEGIVEEILKLRGQLDELIGLTDYVKEYGDPRTEDGVTPTTSLPAPVEGPALDTVASV